MGCYLKVAEDEGEEPIELPLEEDGTLLLSTLTAQFPGTSGLKFRTESNTFRGVRLADVKFHPPEESWGDTVYYCVFLKENKRKSDDNNDNLVAKTKRIYCMKCTDLIVLGIPWDLSEHRLRTYFEQFGELLMAMIKKDSKTGQSKGYGFIRFANYESQVRALSAKHKIDNRVVTVRIPISQEGSVPSSKIFVGRVTEDITAEDLLQYFSKFGEVIDIFIPKPFRAFAFVTFLDVQVAQSLLGEDHIIKGVSVHIGGAAPKNNSRANSTDGFNNEGFYSPPNKNVRKDKSWSSPNFENQNFQQNPQQNMTAGLLNALGNLNPALIAALNQASWELMNSNNSTTQPPPVPPQQPITTNYPTPLPSGSSPSRQYNTGYPTGTQFRENWWNSGYANSRPTASNFNKPVGNTANGYFTRRKNYM
ncbi:TAR DNA-binding protein 43-like [Planococcus citri]|uniref:TAR DNA-binding protein 43-like n=1 Tax=Planococcus citri TaxID=170843 RepID=UPI0031F8E847